jgi:hypothetical protein
MTDPRFSIEISDNHSLLKSIHVELLLLLYVHSVLLNVEIPFFSYAEADGALDKARKHKKRQLEDTYNLIVKKRKVF